MKRIKLFKNYEVITEKKKPSEAQLKARDNFKNMVTGKKKDKEPEEEKPEETKKGEKCCETPKKESKSKKKKDKIEKFSNFTP